MAIPGAGLYGQEMSLAEQAYEAALADINRRRTSLLQQLGMRPVMDAQGNITSLQVDTKNPYGQYQQLRRNEGQNLDIAEQDSIGRGLGHGQGLAHQGETKLRYDQHVQDLNFSRDAMSNLYGLENQKQQALQTKNWSLLTAQQAALQAAAAAGAWQPGPTVPSDPTPSDPGTDPYPVGSASNPTGTTAAVQQRRASLASVYGRVAPDNRPGVRGPGAPLPRLWRPPVSTQRSRQLWGMH